MLIPSKKEIGEYVRRTRQQKYVGTLKFSKIVGINENTLRNIEVGNKGYNIDILYKILDKL